MRDLYQEQTLELYEVRYKCDQLEHFNGLLVEENKILKMKLSAVHGENTGSLRDQLDVKDNDEELTSKAEKKKAKKKKKKLKISPELDLCISSSEPQTSCSVPETEKLPEESREQNDPVVQCECSEFNGEKNLPSRAAKDFLDEFQQKKRPAETETRIVAKVNTISVVGSPESTGMPTSFTVLNDENVPCRSCSGTGLYPRPDKFVMPVHQKPDRRRDFSCFYCHKLGHRAFECRMKLRLCYRCGSSNHLVSECEKKSRNESPVYRRACFICGDEKHIARTCEKRFTRTGVIYEPSRYENYLRDESS